MNPGKYSIGIGDRFGHQGAAQLRAIIEAGKKSIDITPVWNKSNREHLTICTNPEDVRMEADKAILKPGSQSHILLMLTTLIMIPSTGSYHHRITSQLMWHQASGKRQNRIA